MDNLSLSDIASVTGNKDGFLEGNGIIILILFFLIFGFGGGAWGNNQQGTQAEVQRGFDTQAIISKLDGITNGICSNAYENAQPIRTILHKSALLPTIRNLLPYRRYSSLEVET